MAPGRYSGVLQTPSADEIVGLASKASTIGTPFVEIGHVDAPGPCSISRRRTRGAVAQPLPILGAVTMIDATARSARMESRTVEVWPRIGW
jgi:hypothetical protein